MKPTVTLSLRKYKKLKKELKEVHQVVAHAQQQVERHKGISASERQRAEGAVNLWDRHSNDICDALGPEYYSDDGAGFDYDNMITGIARIKQEVHEAKEDSNRLYEELASLKRMNTKFCALWQAAMAWAAQGSRSRWSTRVSLALWDAVKETEREMSDRTCTKCGRPIEEWMIDQYDRERGTGPRVCGLCLGDTKRRSTQGERQ